MHELDPRLVVQILQFLLTAYGIRRARSKPISDQKEGSQAEPSAQLPNPEKLEELIKDVEKTKSQTQETISIAIENKFPPSEAKQIKEDFAAFAILAIPPNFVEYDFSGLIQTYVEQIQAIAMKADLFRLRGWKGKNGIRLLKMPDSAAALLPSHEVSTAVYCPGQIVQARVKDYASVLTDKQQGNPLLVVMNAEFAYASYGLGNQRTEQGNQIYRIGPGQESNWIQFGIPDQNRWDQVLPFQGFEYPLKATNVRSIFAALKKDIVSHLRDVEEERPILYELRKELDGLTAIIPRDSAAAGGHDNN
jgi:hypothetical protein